jgi:hypothetical protein
MSLVDVDGRFCARSYLLLGANLLTGTIPQGITAVANTLSALELNGNKLEGVIPSFRGFFSLTYATLVRPRRCLLRCPRVHVVVFADSCRCTETLCPAPSRADWRAFPSSVSYAAPTMSLCTVGACKRRSSCLCARRTLYLHDNKLNGTIPATLGESPSLQTVWLGNNPLTGTLAVEVVAMFLRQVVLLVLCDTDLVGIVPVSLLAPSGTDVSDQ